jgi:ABC-type multidrug transport system fused ATPase/permease subunit
VLNPPILILDDSTSSVDTETEHKIHQAMKEVVKGRTTFVIAHRLSTLKEADLILVMDKGEIVQRGSHERLVSRPGPYQSIYELQFRPQESVETNGHQPTPETAGWSLTAPSPAGGAE